MLGKGYLQSWGWTAQWCRKRRSHTSKASSVTSVAQGSRIENGLRSGLAMGVDWKDTGQCVPAQLLEVKSNTLGG